MFEPSNDSEVCATDQPMTFSGNVLAGGTEVRIESADNPNGPFTLVAEVFAGPWSSFTGTARWRTGAIVYTWSGVIRGVVTERHDAPGASGGRVGFVEGAMVIVRAVAEAGSPPASVRVWPPATTDATGAFEIRHLAPGR